ncbi:MAG: hypothetical protein MSA50_03675 [Veillonellaceae bacterium]|nr:hypothetical protein [Veillonellaceae bacterium]MDD6126672.1 hypothetical protein [Veillonellaceae bacterium]
MKITYANKRVEKCFTDYGRMQRLLGLETTKKIKIHMNHLEAAEHFGDFLSLGLGHPEPLTGYEHPRYSVHVTKNTRLILEPNATKDTVTICTEIEVEGVSDYHGGKENWYIS